MPAGKRTPSNATLYTLITFVGLFIVTLVVSIIYYVKAEEYRTEAATLRTQRDELASSAQLRKIGTIIGAKQPGKSRLGTMLDYLDSMVSLTIRGVPEDTSAEVKVDTVKRKVKQTLEPLAREHLDFRNLDPNTTGLVPIIEKLKTKLDNVTSTALTTQQQLKNLQNRFDDAMTAGFEKEQILLAEKEKYQQQVNDIKQNYNELKDLMKQTTDQQVKTLMAQFDEERANRKIQKQELLRTQAELKIAENRVKRTQEILQAIVPPPDTEVAAYQPDGKIILIDDQAKIVHLNMGSDDRIYRGLTFSVYEKNMPIPKDGRGKAEIEVFNVGKTISAARITRSQIKKPIILDDNIANLIWDSDKTNVFVIAGQFDLDDDGNIDYDAVNKIKTLIEKWGGRVSDNVSIDTDFVILGKSPQVLRKPNFEQMEVDPMAMEKYEDSLQKLISYKEVKNHAQVLSVPVFNTERFLYFIGYKTQSTRPGAF